jgi:hypothetical protein
LVLRDAVVAGRLTLEEFSERVGVVQSARTHGELAALQADLPSEPRAHPSEAQTSHHRAVCSRIVRRGPWALDARMSFRSVFGTIDLDLRQATLPGPEVELAIHNICGTVSVLVPAGVDVRVEGGGWCASEVVDTPTVPPAAGAPVLRIRASGACGTLYVRSEHASQAIAGSLRRGDR